MRVHAAWLLTSEPVVRAQLSSPHTQSHGGVGPRGLAPPCGRLGAQPCCAGGCRAGLGRGCGGGAEPPGPPGQGGSCLPRQVREGLPPQLALHRQLPHPVPPSAREGPVLLPAAGQGGWLPHAPRDLAFRGNRELPETLQDEKEILGLCPDSPRLLSASVVDMRVLPTPPGAGGAPSPCPPPVCFLRARTSLSAPVGSTGRFGAPPLSRSPRCPSRSRFAARTRPHLAVHAPVLTLLTWLSALASGGVDSGLVALASDGGMGLRAFS